MVNFFFLNLTIFSSIIGVIKLCFSPLMVMTNHRKLLPKKLVSQLLRGKEISPDELEEINHWYYTTDIDTHELDLVLKEIRPEKILDNIKIKAGIKNDEKRNKTRIFLSIAAGISLIFILGFLIYSNKSVFEPTNEETIFKIVSTVSGERKKGFLPDGSLVFLKENSKIQYQEDFSANRTVLIEGEVFFQVKKINNNPFKVKSRKLETTVLGTEFLVSDKREGTELVFVKSGKVKVTQISDPKNKIVISKNQAVSVQVSTHEFELNDITNNEKYLSWMDGTLVIESANATKIAEEISNWFGVEVINKASNSDCLISGAYQRMNLEEILEMINYSVNLNYNYENGKLTIYDLTCKK